MDTSTVISLTREEAQAIWDNSPRAKARRVNVGDLLICKTERFDPSSFRVVEVVGASLSTEANGGGWLKVKAIGMNWVQVAVSPVLRLTLSTMAITESIRR